MLSSTQMAKKETYTCRFGHCKHESKEIPKDEAVKIGNGYYHKDCAKNRNNTNLTIELFEKHINPNPVQSQLRAVINNILYTKNIDSDFLVFALKYFIEHRIPLRYPQGLYYVVQNVDAKSEFDKKMAEKYKNIKIELSDTNETSFTHKPAKQKGFADILGGA